jgi:TonB family protein
VFGLHSLAAEIDGKSTRYALEGPEERDPRNSFEIRRHCKRHEGNTIWTVGRQSVSNIDMRTLLFSVLIGVGFWATPARTIAADCVRRSPAAANDERRLIFAGVAREVKHVAAGAIVTFAVERSWNSSPRAAFITVYSVRSSTDAEWVQFTPGVRYIVVTRKLTEAEHEAFGKPAFQTLSGVGPCPDGTMVYEQAERQGMIAALGRGVTPLRPPTRIHYVPPVWPDAARQAGVRGTVIVEVVIDTQGNVSSAKILRGIPLLDQAALDCVRQWRFEPQTWNDHPMSVAATVTVTFGER